MSPLVPAISADVTVPSSSIIPSSGQVKSSSFVATESIVESPTSVVPSTSSSLPNAHPMLTRRGLFHDMEHARVHLVRF